MAKPVKIILSVITALVFLIVIAIFTLPFFIDPNDFKPEITAAVKDKTGRDLTLPGELKLSIFPWLGISTGKMALGNAAGFQDKPFATLEESDIKVKLLPLLTKKIEVSRIVLKGLTLNLAKNPQGDSNWIDLTKPDATKNPPPPPIGNIGIQDETEALTLLTIGGITLENAQINWDDQRSGKHLLIKDVNLNTGNFSYDEPHTVALSLTVLNPETQFTESIKLTTELTINKNLDSFLLSHSDVQTISEGENVPGKSLTAALTVADTALDLAKQTVNISGLQFTSNDVTLSADITGNTINDKPSFQGSLLALHRSIRPRL